MARRPRGYELVDRRWATQRISDWLGSGSGAGTLVVTGGAGTGKTTLLTALAASRSQALPVGRFHAVHLCRGPVLASTDPIRVLSGVARRLARSVPGYATALRRLGRGRLGPDDDGQFAAWLVLDKPTPAAAYEAALRVPFEALAARRGRQRWRRIGAEEVVVAVDGLDEAMPGTGTAGLVDLFADRIGEVAPGLRLLLTVRSGAALDRLRPDNVFDLVADCPPGVDDISEYLERVGGLPADTRAAIAEAATGCFLYAAVAHRLAADTGPQSVAEPPPGLGALYDRALPDGGAPDSAPGRVLRLLARSRDAGLSAGQVAAMLRTEPAEVGAVLDRSRALLTGAERLRPHHRCLSEHLATTTSDPLALDWLIAAHLNQRGRPHPGAGWQPYALRNLLPHLADAAGHGAPARDAICHRITDPEYVAAAVLGVGVDDVLSGLSYVDMRMGGALPDTAPLARILRRQADTMRLARQHGDATLVDQQLAYEAASTGARILGRAFAKQLGNAGILTLWATRDNRLRLLRNAIHGHAGQVNAAMVTADGTTAVTASKDRATCFWRLASGRLVHAMPSLAAVSTGYIEPGARPALAPDGTMPPLWRMELRLPFTESSGPHTRWIAAFATDDSGTIGLSGDMDGQATVWDLVLGEPIVRLPCMGGVVTAVAVTPDAAIAATATLHGEVTTWDLHTAAPRHRLPRQAIVHALALSPSGNRLLVGNDSLAVYALDEVERPTLLARLHTSHPVTALAVNPAMPAYAVFGAACGQVGYVRLPVDVIDRPAR
jgi:hypothetical protein